MSLPIDRPTDEEISAQEENQMKRCVQATVITPKAPIVTLRLEYNLDMALRLELVGAFVQAVWPQPLPATQHAVDSLGPLEHHHV